jgi:Uncharacterized bacitracin resistance protein
VLSLSVSAEFLKMFFVVIQLGSIFAVFTLYFRKLNPLSPKKSREEKKAAVNIWLKVAVASIPAAVVGVLFDDLIEEMLKGPFVIAVMLIVYGIAFIIIERVRKNKPNTREIASVDDISYKNALAIGAFQVLALIPGTSRSGSTIIGGMLTGTSRTAAAEFSFFLAIPVMLGASLVKVLKFGFAFTGEEVAILLVGMVVAFAVSVVAIKFLMDFVKRHSFELFGWYRIVLGALVIVYFAVR